MVAEVLAGIALVSSAVKGIKSTIDTAKDIKDIAGSIDQLLDGAEQVEKKRKLAQRKKGKAGQWQNFLRLKFKSVEETGDGTSIQEIAAEVIEQKQVEKEIRAMKILINKKFGPTTWSDILIMRQQRIDELRKRKEKEKVLEEERQRKIMSEIFTLLYKEKVAYDITGYPKAPPSFRVWGGGTVEPRDIQKLLPWIEWAVEEVKLQFNE